MILVLSTPAFASWFAGGSILGNLVQVAVAKPPVDPTPTEKPDVWCHHFPPGQPCAEELKKKCTGDWEEGQCPVNPSVTPTPTEEPTITPTVTVTPTPTDAPSCKEEGNKCKIDKDKCCSGLICVEEEDSLTLKKEDKFGTCQPEPTASPSPTPTGEPNPTPTEQPRVSCEGVGNDAQGHPCGWSPEQPGHDQGPPTCTDATTINLPANIHVTRSGTDATVTFFVTQGDHANIYYRELKENDWTHSVIGINAGDYKDNYISYTIHNLKAGVGYTFGIQQVIGCGGGQLVTAVVIDGPQSQTFGYSYWEWSK